MFVCEIGIEQKDDNNSNLGGNLPECSNSKATNKMHDEVSFC